jgi:hypothetical protein
MRSVDRLQMGTRQRNSFWVRYDASNEPAALQAQPGAFEQLFGQLTTQLRRMRDMSALPASNGADDARVPASARPAARPAPSGVYQTCAKPPLREP